MKRRVAIDNADIAAREKAETARRLSRQCVWLDCVARLDGKPPIDADANCAPTHWRKDWSAEDKARALRGADREIERLSSLRNAYFARLCDKELPCAVNPLAYERAETAFVDGRVVRCRVGAMLAAPLEIVPEDQTSVLRAEDGVLSNGLLSVRIGARGEIRSIFRRDVERQFVDCPIKAIVKIGARARGLRAAIKPFKSAFFVEGGAAVCLNQYEDGGTQIAEKISLTAGEEWVRVDYAIAQNDCRHALAVAFDGMFYRAVCREGTDEGFCDLLALRRDDDCGVSAVATRPFRVVGKDGRKSKPPLVDIVVGEPRGDLALRDTFGLILLPHLGASEDSRAAELHQSLRDPLIYCDRTPRIKSVLSIDSDQIAADEVRYLPSQCAVRAVLREDCGVPCTAVVSVGFRARAAYRVTDGEKIKITAKEISFAAHEIVTLLFEL